MKITYRRLNPADRDKLQAFLLSSDLPIRPQGRESPQSLWIQLKNPSIAFIGAFHGEAFVGVICASHDGRKGWINRLDVAPPYRHQGIAQRLIHMGEAFLKTAGIGLSTCLIEEGNNPSFHLFQKMGYQHIKEITYWRKLFNEGA